MPNFGTQERGLRMPASREALGGAPLLTCKSCGNPMVPDPVISLGPIPIGANFLEPHETHGNGALKPLDLVLCRSCFLLQILHTDPCDGGPDRHLYFTGASRTVIDHMQKLSCCLIEKRHLGPSTLVLDIGSNDGSLLSHFSGRGIPVLGIEPTARAAETAIRRHAIPTIQSFFNSSLARDLKRQGVHPRLIIATEVLEIIPDLDDFVEALRVLMDEESFLVLEIPYAPQMVGQLRFDAISHDRLYWFTLLSLDRLLRSHGIFIQEAEVLASFRGGTLRVLATKLGIPVANGSFLELMREEARMGVQSTAFYASFSENVSNLCGSIGLFLSELSEGGKKRIAAYGAGVKAGTLLNALHLDGRHIDFLVDVNPMKQGLSMPGVRLPVLPPSALEDRTPHYLLICALDFVEEIIEEQAAFAKRGGKLIIPIPEPRVI